MLIHDLLAKKPNKELHALALYAWGIDRQEDQTIQEMSELTQAILKNRQLNGDEEAQEKILIEIADVQNTLNQLIIWYFGDLNSPKLKQYMRLKLERTNTKLATTDEIQSLLKFHLTEDWYEYVLTALQTTKEIHDLRL